MTETKMHPGSNNLSETAIYRGKPVAPGLFEEVGGSAFVI